MLRVSAGILMYRLRETRPEYLLVHPGGPFWREKDLGAWSIPKGEITAGEELLACALREFSEELGTNPSGPYSPLSPIRQRGGKLVHAWACQGDIDTESITGGRFQLEWPPRSGKYIEAREIDRAEYFSGAIARTKINAAQISLIDECEEMIMG